ncbi:LuxR C-terminal-related transcriptional regulator [Microbulbifer guangxiensis]|uniref:LuxR C-terminal-related transcriptional regulator n=1 Tax=Microbulbifer guangxiensis TaxID=2904249 RepID=UPI001F017081|nr:LuxR C-terminal-related transcriptional regulator [Microbulbifer guangxiensis]
MKADKHLLQAVWEHSSEHLSPESAETDLIELDDRLSSVFSGGPSYYFVVDFADMQIKHASASVRHLLGLAPDSMTVQDILDRTHPDDLEFVANAERAAFEIVYGRIPAEKRHNYKVSYCFRCKTADGSYHLLNHQAMVLATDTEGRLARSLCIHTSIEHLTSQNNYCISIIGMASEPSYLNLDISQAQKPKQVSGPLFSEREMEIIRLMSRGMTSRDIAETLCIAANTVKNHRKNILSKSGSKNTGELITRCITDGLL